MKLSEIKSCLSQMETLSFQLPDGSFVPKNFHVTEIGLVTKKFIDCGGTVRNETIVNFQLWEDSGDEEHRLKSEKLLQIISLSEKLVGIGDFEVEVEYQEKTIGKYSLGFNGSHFLLLNKQTACLAMDQCGVPSTKLKTSLRELTNQPQNACTPGGGCC